MGSLSSQAIIGIVVAAVFVLIILGFIIYILVNQNKPFGDGVRFEIEETNNEEDRQYFTKDRGKCKGII